MEKVWLVEIGLRVWIGDLATGGRIVTWEEVLADNEFGARVRAWEQFERRAKYEPVLRRHLATNMVQPQHCCVTDAVEV